MIIRLERKRNRRSRNVKGMIVLNPISETAPCLAPDEKVLWQGRNMHATSIRLRPMEVAFAMCIVLAAGCFGVFIWQPSPAWGTGLGMIGKVFLTLGMLLTFGFLPVLVLTWQDPQERNIRYLVTSSAALIVLRSSQSRVLLMTIPFADPWGVPMRIRENHDGTGTLYFCGPFAKATSKGRSAYIKPVFWNIENPRDVYRLIREQADDLAAKQSAAGLIFDH
jgi:hypothetical protein